MKGKRVDIAGQLEKFSGLCRKYGIKATHQRAEIYRELVSTEEHPDAEKVYERVKRRIPAVSLDTVYRTLRLLEDKGVISRVGFLKDRMRFDANIEQHHHFICGACGRIVDFYDGDLDRLSEGMSMDGVGKVDSAHVELRGTCRKCLERQRRGR